VVGISGNLKRPSRTRTLVEAVAATLAHRRDIDLSVYDLLDAGPGLGAAYVRGDLTPEAARVVEAIEAADALIVGTLVYKGSYTGLFKHLFDLVDPGALTNKPVCSRPRAADRVTRWSSSTSFGRCSDSSRP
jgi:FMN reductase